jgi:hypothetical protein
LLAIARLLLSRAAQIDDLAQILASATSFRRRRSTRFSGFDPRTAFSNDKGP